MELFQNCMTVLWDFNLPYKNTVHARFVLCHVENRGKLMLSPLNAHRNAATIFLTGADRKQLSNAVAIELAPNGPDREKNIAANVNLVSRSDGLLAPVNGQERLLSLGAGHTAAWCKLADLGGKTSQECLKDSKGNIDQHKIKTNSELRAMVEKGWEWIIIPHEVDAAFPRFAKIAQKALNTPNHVAGVMGELESACVLADSHEDPSIDDAMALQSLTELCVPCAGWASIIQEFVKVYGGGQGAPQIRFMDTIRKSFNCDIVLGETFWSAITSTTFANKVCLYPLVRVAFALCNLSGSHQQDGIARTLVKSDVTKAASKASMKRADEAEQVLKHAEAIVESLKHQKAEASVSMPCVTAKDLQVSLVQILGVCYVRVGLWLTNKGKSGWEAKDYTLDQIKALLLSDISKVAGFTVSYTEWEEAPVAEDSAPSAPSAGEDPQAHTTATLENHSDPKWLAGRAGFKVDSVIYEKLNGQAASVENCFKITDINTEGTVSMVQACSYHGAAVSGHVQLTELLTNWQTVKIELPIQLNVGSQRPAGIAIDATKARVYKALVEADRKSLTDAAKTLVFWRKPDQVRTSVKEFAVGQLTVVPLTILTSISTKSNGVKICTLDGVGYWALQPPKPATDASEEKVKDAIFAAFWWLKEVSSKADANMELGVLAVDGIDIPVYRNRVPLKAFTKLTKFVAPAAVVKSSFVSEGKAAPKKRQKRS